jgi:D-beta-D-heptose 7-phosphate kinase/D-beta-D-heptose 1-phosphate adenosyltransferase|tara:strand:+ start:2698 stop:3474 length:777 start_codon:yes stop_codon:yes gene_type:complete
MDTQQQKCYKILVIGENCKDIYHFGTASRLSPEAPVPIIKLSHKEYYPGMAANVANNLIALNNEVCLFTNIESIEKTRIVESRFNHHLLRIDDEPDVASFSWENYDGNSLDFFDAFVISDYNKGFIPHEALPELITLLSSHGKPVFIDSKKKDLSSFKKCIIKINQKEYEESKDIPTDCELIITLGANGASWRGNNFSAEKTEVFDVCGAGDTFLAGLVNRYLDTSGNMRESINFANKCGSLAVNKFGTFCLPVGELK